MRQILCSVAASLDGYIARPGGEYDWIPDEPNVDWGAFLARFDTVLIGRRTWEVIADSAPEEDPTVGMRTVVVSTTLDPAEHPGVEIVGDDPAGFVEALRREDGEDVWLMGGGVLFRSLLDAGLVDGVEVAVVPVLLGQGIPLLPSWKGDARLELLDMERYPSGIVQLRYRVLAG